MSVTPFNRRFIRWLADTISCKDFSTHVARGIEPPPGGLKGRFYFWLHWVWCPYCRQYWTQMRKLGALLRGNLQGSGSVADAKRRLKQKLRQTYAS